MAFSSAFLSKTEYIASKLPTSSHGELNGTTAARLVFSISPKSIEMPGVFWNAISGGLQNALTTSGACLLHSSKKKICPDNKHSAVPEIALLDVADCSFIIRFLDK